MVLSNLSQALRTIDIFLGTLDTEIGELAVFSLRVKGIRKLSELLGNNEIEDFSPDSYIREFMRVIVYPLDMVVDEDEPEGVLLSSEQVQELSEASLNKFSKLFLVHHDYLFRERITHRKTEDEKTVVSHEYGDVIHPQEDDEQVYEYLYRLLVLEKEAERKRSLTIMEGFGAHSLLSDQLNSQFNATNMMGAALSDSLDKIRTFTSAASLAAKVTEPMSATMASLHQSGIDWASINPLRAIPEDVFDPPNRLEPVENLSNILADQQREKAERRQKNDELNERQDQHLGTMAESMSETVEYMRRLDENQRLAAEEGQKASEESAKVANTSIKIARAGIKLAIWGIALNVAVLSLTGFGLWLSWYLNSSGETATQHEIQVVSGGFDKLSAGFTELADAVIESNSKRDIAEKAIALSHENLELKKLAKEQSQRVATLENQQAEQIKTLQEQLQLLQSSKKQAQSIP